jgi:hypothetical protein
MPKAVFSLLWNFILDSNGSNTSKAGYSANLKTISSFMVVCKTAKEEFHACHGWSQCALALKREATFKCQVIADYEEEGSKLAKARVRALLPLTPDELKASRSFVAKADDRNGLSGGKTTHSLDVAAAVLVATVIASLDSHIVECVYMEWGCGW